MIQFDFYDHSIVNNLVPIKTMRPDEVYFFIDQKDVNSKLAINTKRAVETIVPSIHFEYVVIDSNNLYDIHNKLIEKMLVIPNQTKVYLDLTGGNSIMAITAFRIAREFGNVVLMHADFHEKAMLEFPTFQRLQSLVDITLDDYLHAKGAKTTGNSRHVPEKDEFQRIQSMAEYVFQHLSTWQFLCQIFQKKAIYEQFKLTKTTVENEQQIDVVPMIEKLVENGFLIDQGNQYYRYPSKKYKEYLITYGIWLELYIYIKALDYFDDCRIGYLIDWNAQDEKMDPKNEIDVVVMKGSIPYFISCKMKKPTIYDLYEVGYLAYYFAGDITKGIMATTYSAVLSDQNYSIENRCKEMSIGLITTNDFQTKSAQAIFEKVIG